MTTGGSDREAGSPVTVRVGLTGRMSYIEAVILAAIFSYYFASLFAKNSLIGIDATIWLASSVFAAVTGRYLAGRFLSHARAVA
jgi:hypothetical protein